MTHADATVYIPPLGRDGSWELVRAGSSDYLYAKGLFYQNSRFDFPNASFDTYEWTRKSPNKRLIDADKGCAMISGVAGRIGAGTDFKIRAPPETCCGNGAQRKFPLARR
jgi:hypothetical protein